MANISEMEEFFTKKYEYIFRLTQNSNINNNQINYSMNSISPRSTSLFK